MVGRVKQSFESYVTECGLSLFWPKMLSLGQTMKLVVGNPNMKYVRVIKQEPIMSILAKQKKTPTQSQ